MVFGLPGGATMILWRIIQLIILMFICSIFFGCAQTQYVATAKPFSRSVKQVCISKTDQITEGTASQIEANNLALSKLYGSRVACKKSPAQ
jgi:hypothetical protein